MVLSSAQLPPCGIAASQTILISPDSMEIRFNFFSSKYAIHLLSFEKKGCLIPFSEEEDINFSYLFLSRSRSQRFLSLLISASLRIATFLPFGEIAIFLPHWFCIENSNFCPLGKFTGICNGVGLPKKYLYEVDFENLDVK